MAARLHKSRQGGGRGAFLVLRACHCIIQTGGTQVSNGPTFSRRQTATTTKQLLPFALCFAIMTWLVYT